VSGTMNADAFAAGYASRSAFSRVVIVIRVHIVTFWKKTVGWLTPTPSAPLDMTYAYLVVLLLVTAR
jgi:hypothetical protein